MPTDKPRYYAFTRQLTGTPLVFHAYVMDRETGKAVRACLHKHTRRGTKSGAIYASECADRMLVEWLRRDPEALRDAVTPKPSTAYDRLLFAHLGGTGVEFTAHDVVALVHEFRKIEEAARLNALGGGNGLDS